MVKQMHFEHIEYTKSSPKSLNSWLIKIFINNFSDKRILTSLFISLIINK